MDYKCFATTKVTKPVCTEEPPALTREVARWIRDKPFDPRQVWDSSSLPALRSRVGDLFGGEIQLDESFDPFIVWKSYHIDNTDGIFRFKQPNNTPMFTGLRRELRMYNFRRSVLNELIRQKALVEKPWSPTSETLVDFQLFLEGNAIWDDSDNPTPLDFSRKRTYALYEHFLEGPKNIDEEMMFMITLREANKMGRMAVRSLPMINLLRHAWQKERHHLLPLLTNSSGPVDVLTNSQQVEFDFEKLPHWPLWAQKSLGKLPIYLSYGAVMLAITGQRRAFFKWWEDALFASSLRDFAMNAFKWIRMRYALGDEGIHFLTTLPMLTVKARLAAFAMWYVPARYHEAPQKHDMLLANRVADGLQAQGNFGKAVWRMVFGRKKPSCPSEARVLYPPDNPWVILNAGKMRINGNPPVGACAVEVNMSPWGVFDQLLGMSVSRKLGMDPQVNASALTTIAAHIAAVAEIIRLLMEGKYSRAFTSLFSTVWLANKHRDLAGGFLTRFIQAWIWWQNTRNGNVPDGDSVYSEDVSIFNELEEECASLEAQGTPLADVMQSDLANKFVTMLGALMMPDVVVHLPGFMNMAIKHSSEFWMNFRTVESVSSKVWEFFWSLLTRTRDFLETWDFNVFLQNAGIDSYVRRCVDLVGSSVKEKPTKFLMVEEQIKVGQALLDEGDRYRKRDKTKGWGLFGPAHERAYTAVSTSIAAWKSVVSSAAERKRAPFSAVLLGPPGTAKTTTCQALGRYVVSRKRAESKGNKDLQATDVYTVPVHDDFWNNCYNPSLLIWNDLPGNGFAKDGLNIPDMLRMSVDTCPFFTPQAALDNKAWNTIDPDAVMITSNATVWDFKMFGTDWAKLVRRYKNVYYVDYPLTCYAGDKLIDPEIQVNATLAPQMRIFSAKMVHHAGIISFEKGKQVAVGLDALELLLKRAYLEYERKPLYKPNEVKRCCIGTAYSFHELHDHQLCMDGCDYEIQPAAPLFEQVEIPPYVPIHLAPIVDEPEEKAEEPPKLQEQCGSIAHIVSKGVDKSTGAIVEIVGNSANNVQAKAGEVLEAVSQEVSRTRAIGKELKKTMQGFQFWLDLIGKMSAAFALLGGLYTAYKMLKPVKKVVEEIESQAIKNPTDHDFSLSVVQRYGMQDTNKREMENPPTYPVNERAHLTFSPASATTSMKDLCGVMRKNEVVISSGAPFSIVGTFLTPTILAVNYHCYERLKPYPVWEVNKQGVSHKLEFKPDKIWVRLESDLVLMKTPPFPATNIVKHFPLEVGKFQQVSLDKGLSFVDAVRVDLDATSIKMHKAIDSLRYPSTYAKGDCGRIIIGSVNGRPLLFGQHFAGDTDTKRGYCAVLTQEILLPGVDYLSAGTLQLENLWVSNPYTSLKPLHSQSKLRTEATGVSFEVAGTEGKVRSQAPSRVVRTKLAAVCDLELSEPKVVPQLQRHGKHHPVKGWVSPMVHKMNGMKIRCSDPDLSYLQWAIDDFLDGAPVMPLAPLNLHQAIAGVPGDPLLKHINLTTSSGIYGKFYGAKSNLVDLLKIDPNLKQHVERQLSTLSEGGIVERQTWALKDEVVNLSKEEVKKYRFFMVSDFHNLLQFRCFVAPLVALMYRNKEFYEAYGAFNPASLDYGKLLAQLREKRFLLLADMKHMDSSHKSFMSDAVAQVFATLARRCGYNEAAIKIVYNLIVTIVFSLCEVDGDVAFFSEGMGSGVYVTFIFNCISLSLMYRVAWFRTGHLTRFRDDNKLVTGGDDSAATTNSEKFTQPAIARVFLLYGYELSPPTDKSGALKDFYEWEEFVFLKRSPSVLDYGGRPWEVGKLETDSIWKSLGFWLKDGQITEADRMAQVLDAAQREFALHGKEELLSFQGKVAGVYEYPVKTYEDIMEKYVIGKLYEGVLADFIEKDAATFDVGFGGVEPSKFNPSDDLVTAAVNEVCTVERLSLESQSGNCLFRLDQHASKTEGKVHGPTPSLVNKSIPKNIFESSGASIQKGTVDFNLVSDVATNQAPPHYKADYAVPKDEASIQEYLHRPVHCGSFVWSAITPALTQNFCLPYAEWVANSRVADKLDGYKFWRAKPKLRFVVNGFSFYYGKLMIAVFPTPGDNGLVLLSTGTRNVTSVNQMFQMPHVEIDPSVSQTYDLDIPWYCARDWYDNTLDAFMTNPEISLSAGVAAPLSSANTEPPTDVSIQVYIIMEQVELTIPCAFSAATPPALRAEGPEEASEDTPVADATAVMSQAASVLSKVPALSAFATPLANGLGVASSIARWLGYGKPVHIQDTLVSFETVENMALMNGRSAAQKITADTMQGVSVASSVTGVGSDDDMLLANVLNRPGLLTRLDWNSGAGLISAIAVNPISEEIMIGASSLEILGQPTPLRWITTLFHFWTGSIVYDIEIVCSGFHRGTLGISWVPAGSTVPATTMEYPNTFLSQVVDIAETRKVSFEVPYGLGQPWMQTSLSAANNGFLYFYEVNTLKAVTPTALVYIIITVRAGPDYDVSKIDFDRVCEWRYTERTVAPPAAFSSLEAQGDFSGDQPPVGPGNTLLEGNDYGGRGTVYFGEKYTSIKQIMNRYSLAGSLVTPALTSNWFRAYLPTLPNSRIAVYNPVASVTPCMSLHNFFPPAFLAFRGGIRHKIMKGTLVTGGDPVATRTYSVASFETGTLDFNVQAVNQSLEIQQQSANGGVWTYNSVKGATEIEFPFTHAYRFVDPRPFWRAFQPTEQHPALKIISNSFDMAAGQGTFVFTAAADDVSLHYFFCTPTIYKNA